MLLLRHRGGFLNPAPPPVRSPLLFGDCVRKTPSAVLFPGRGLFCGDAGGMPGLPAIDETRNSMLRCLGCRNKRIRRRLRHGRKGMAARRGIPFGHSWRPPLHTALRDGRNAEGMRQRGEARPPLQARQEARRLFGISDAFPSTRPQRRYCCAFKPCMRIRAPFN